MGGSDHSHRAPDRVLPAKPPRATKIAPNDPARAERESGSLRYPTASRTANTPARSPRLAKRLHRRFDAAPATRPIRPARGSGNRGGRPRQYAHNRSVRASGANSAGREMRPCPELDTAPRADGRRAVKRAYQRYTKARTVPVRVDR